MRVVADVAGKVGAALIAGTTFVTFVAVAGAAITWLRFYTAQLPATQAIGPSSAASSASTSPNPTTSSGTPRSASTAGESTGGRFRR